MNPSISPERAVSIGLCATLCAAGVASCALAGPTWDLDYTDDAKDGAGTAQVITAPLAPIISIHGTLTGSALVGSDFVDMYMFEITHQTTLSISCAGGLLGGEANFDAQLFLFKRKGNSGNVRALALKGNNDAAAGNWGARIGDELDPNADYITLSRGWYYIAITGVGMEAFAETGNIIWPDLGTPGQTVSGNENGLGGWNGQGVTGDYVIRLHAVSGGMLPSPGAMALLGLAGLVRRRNR